LGAWTVLIWVIIGTGGELFEDGNEPRVSMNEENFLLTEETLAS